MAHSPRPLVAMYSRPSGVDISDQKSECFAAVAVEIGLCHRVSLIRSLRRHAFFLKFFDGTGCLRRRVDGHASKDVGSLW